MVSGIPGHAVNRVPVKVRLKHPGISLLVLSLLGLVLVVGVLFHSAGESTRFVQVRAFGFSVCALDSTGRLRCWNKSLPQDTRSSIADPFLEVSNVVSFAVGLAHACYETQQGKTECVGSDKIRRQVHQDFARGESEWHEKCASNGANQ